MTNCVSRFFVGAAVFVCVGAASAAQPPQWWQAAAGPAVPGTPAIGTEGVGLIDGFGDTFGTGPFQHDIDTMLVTYSPGVSVSVLMTFHAAIAPPSANAPNSAIGYFEFDTDQSAGTGMAPFQNAFAPPAPLLNGMGVDYIADLVSEINHPGAIDIIGPGGIMGFVPIVYSSNSLSFTVPATMLGGDDGLLNFTTIVGTFQEPTDATNQVGTSVVPSPAGALVMGMGAVAALRRRR